MSHLLTDSTPQIRLEDFVDYTCTVSCSLRGERSG